MALRSERTLRSGSLVAAMVALGVAAGVQGHLHRLAHRAQWLIAHRANLLLLDQLAVVEPRATTEAGSDSNHPFASASEISRRNMLTFTPDGARGVAAYVNGTKAASA